MTNEQVLFAFQQRRAVKDFDISRKITSEDFRVLLTVTQSSPSSMGLEPWRIIVCNDAVKNDLMLMASGAKRQLVSCSHFVIFVVTNDLRPDSKYFKHICFDVKNMTLREYDLFKEKLESLQNTKHDLTDDRKRVDWACKQAYIAMATMMYSAMLMKIDSCPIEGFSVRLVNNYLRNNNITTYDEEVALMLALGYSTEKSLEPKPRRHLSEIVTFL